MVIYLMFPIALVAIAFAHEALGIWMGSALPVESGVVLKWLALGVFINAIAQAPYAALQGTGRPDLIAKLHVAELPIYAVAIFVLVRAFGLPGVAMAWVLRVTIDAIALLVVTKHVMDVPLMPGRSAGWIVAVMLVALGIAATLSGGMKIVLVVGALLLFLPLGWLALLSAGEREAILKLRHRRDRDLEVGPEGAT
jgi:O-antigen/teichoic acid export membrane protein